MTGRASLLRRLRQLEDRSGAPDPVRVVITRHILEGAAQGQGEDLEARPVRIVRREFDLYPQGVPTPGGHVRRGPK